MVWANLSNPRYATLNEIEMVSTTDVNIFQKQI